MKVRFKSNVSKATDPDATRFAHSAALVVPTDGEYLAAFATDSRILCCTLAEGELGDADGGNGVLVPGKLCTPAGEVTDRPDGNFQQEVKTRNKLSLNVAAPVEGRFAPVHSVLQEYGVRTVAVSIDPQLLLDLFHSMNTNDKNNKLTLLVPLPETSTLTPTLSDIESRMLRDYPNTPADSGVWGLGLCDDGWFDVCHAPDHNQLDAFFNKHEWAVSVVAREGDGRLTIAQELLLRLSQQWKHETRVASKQCGVLVDNSVGAIMPFDPDSQSIIRHNRLVKQYREYFAAAVEGRLVNPDHFSDPPAVAEPVAVVSPEVADAFDMHGLPNTIVQEPEPLPDTGADEVEESRSMTVEEVLALLA